MPVLAQLLQYAHKVKVRYEKRRSLVKAEMHDLLLSWQNSDKKDLPTVEYTLPVINPIIDAHYIVVGADSSPLQLSRHRSMEIRALSLARVVTNYTVGTEETFNNIEDFPEQDELSTLRYPLLELDFASQAEKADLILVDGSLIRWQWEQLEQEKKLQYVGQYVDLLVENYKRKAPVFAIIDRSASRDIVHWLEIHSQKKFNHFNDQDLFTEILTENTFSPIFRTHSPITDLLPDYNIGYCYYRHALGLLRIEFVLEQEIDPLAWAYLLDQVNKGKGYPWSLIRAHEACVIHEADKAVIEKVLMGDEGLSLKEVWKQKNN